MEQTASKLNKKRLEQLFDFYKKDPTDSFLIYAIATEYKKEEPETALKYFEKLLDDYENYVGTYYHACKLYEQLGMKEKAEKYYIKGLQMCQLEGNMHAYAELKDAYTKFQGLDYEDEV